MENEIPFVDLRQQFKLYQQVYEETMREVCLRGSYILGPQVENFEEKFAEYLGVKEAIGVASGTDALLLSCKALGIGPGDEVLIPANTFIATALGISELGATVVPVDVDPDSFLIDLEEAEKKVSGKTKAVIPVHLYGQSMDMDQVVSFARKHGLIIIEDACQSHGAIWENQRTGTFGSTGCFSFYPAKNLGGFGDGGMIVTNDRQVGEKLRLLRNYGSVKKYIHQITGINSRLDSLQAAILNVKIGFLNDWNRKRFSAACRYAEGLEYINGIKAPVFDRDNSERHVFHLFVVQCERRDELMRYLNDHSVQCGIHYPVPIHLHKAYEFLNLGKGSFPVAERLAERILSLPMFPEISDEQIDRVLATVETFYG